jgi:hypothetical protein
MRADTAHGKPSKSDRLAQIAAPLKPVKSPWFQRRAPVGLEGTFPADGWYWIPNGHATAVFLGRDAGMAEYILRGLLQRELEAAT